MELRISHHSAKHAQETWNQVTIREIYQQGQLREATLLEGETADVLYGYAPDGSCVGLIVTKEKNDVRVIITGFEADEEYWLNV